MLKYLFSTRKHILTNLIFFLFHSLFIKKLKGVFTEIKKLQKRKKKLCVRVVLIQLGCTYQMLYGPEVGLSARRPAFVILVWYVMAFRYLRGVACLNSSSRLKVPHSVCHFQGIFAIYFSKLQQEVWGFDEFCTYRIIRSICTFDYRKTATISK